MLRGDGATANLQPLMRTPIQETTYRDTTVAAGQTYTYAVYAVDTAPTPNVSPLSDRQTSCDSLAADLSHAAGSGYPFQCGSGELRGVAPPSGRHPLRQVRQT